MTRTPVSARRPPTVKSVHRLHREKRLQLSPLRSPRRSIRSNFFRRRDSMDISDDEDDAHELTNYFSPPKKPRPSYTWDDETTLVTALIDDPNANPADPSAKLYALADSLQDPFTRAGNALLQDMAHMLQPAVQRVTSAHRTLSRRIDSAFTTGLLGFDDACKGLEALSIDDQRTLQHTFTTTEARIKDLFARLEGAYRHRDRLWKDLETTLADTLDPTLAALAEVPAATERTIAILEKHAKTLAAKDEDGAATDKIRGMLAKLV